MSTGDETLENERRKIAQATDLMFIDRASRKSWLEFETVNRSSISRPVSEPRTNRVDTIRGQENSHASWMWSSIPGKNSASQSPTDEPQIQCYDFLEIDSRWKYFVSNIRGQLSTPMSTPVLTNVRSCPREDRWGHRWRQLRTWWLSVRKPFKNQLNPVRIDSNDAFYKTLWFLQNSVACHWFSSWCQHPVHTCPRRWQVWT